MKKWFIESLSRRSPDQILVALCGAALLLMVGYDLHRVATRLYAPTGFLMRMDAIASQVNASAVNVKAITKDAKDISGNVKDGVAAWKQTSDTQRIFFQESLPKIVDGVQGNLASMRDLQDKHLAPAVDQVTASAKTLDGAIGQVGDVAGDVSETLSLHVNPLLDSGRTDLDAFLKLEQSKDLAAAMSGLGTTSTQLGLISTDLYAYAHPILHPEPCKTRKCTAGRALRTTAWWLGVGADAAQASRAFTPLRVRVVP